MKYSPSRKAFGGINKNEKNKLIAGLLSFVCAVSMLPVQTLAAKIPHAGFYDVNFEDGNAAPHGRFVWKSKSTVRWVDNRYAAPEDWSCEVVDETTDNKAMKLTFDSEDGDKKLSDNGASVGALLKAEVPPNVVNAANKKWYEYGFRYKIDEPLNMDANHFMTPTDVFDTTIKMGYHNNKLTIDKAEFDPIFGQWVSVKWQVHYCPSAAETSVTISRSYEGDDGNQKTEIMYSADSNVKVSLSWIALQLSSKGMKDGASFMIDDFYLYELEKSDFKTVSFNTNGANETVDDVSTLSGVISLPDKKLTKNGGWQFDGWYRDEALTEPFDGTGVDDNMTVYAKWLKLHTVTFDLDGGTGETTAQTVTDTVELPSDPTKERYEFDGWYWDKDFKTPFDGSGVTGDMTVYAKWNYAWEIKFETNGGEPLEPAYTAKNIKSLPTAVRLGYRFDGWYKDNDTFEQEFDGTNVTEDITVYAKWTKQYKITFDTKGGEAVEPIYTLEDLTSLPETKKQGFRFIGWFADSELKIPFDGTGISGDMTVYAGYDNLIYYEDFENTDGVEYLKQLAPKKYEEFIKDGYGVVDDGSGNKALRLAWELKGGVAFPFEDGGAGLYEISFKIKFPMQPTSYNWMTSFGTPRQGKNLAAVSGCLNNGSISFANKGIAYAPNAEGYISLTYLIDTTNQIAGAKSSYRDKMTKRTVESSFNGIPVTQSVSGIDNIHFAPDYRIEDRGTDYYLDEISVRKIEQEGIEKISVPNGAVDVDISTDVKFYFSSTADTETLFAENIYIRDENGNSVPCEIKSSVESGKTVVSLVPESELEYGKTYTAVASAAICSNGYNIDKSYKSTFKTRPKVWEFSTELVNASTGKAVKTLTAAAGKTVKATMKMRNFDGAESESYFIGAALVDIETGLQIGYAHSQGTVLKGEEKEALSAEFNIPANVTENYKIRYYIWSSAQNRSVITGFLDTP